MERRVWPKAVVPVVVGVVIALIPTPLGLEPYAWWFFALFVATILALILEPIPTAAVGLVAVTLATVLTLVAPGKPADAVRWALSGFSDTTV
jgi:L-tartrate/succinate antiporter